MAVTGVGANGSLSIGGALSQKNIPDSIQNDVIITDSTSTSDLTVEEYVTKYFSDVPVLVAVAKCESRFRQQDKNGKTLVGEVNEFDFGVMQINEMYHGAKAKKLGLNLHTVEGNTAYARYLFENQGLQPWISSSACWKKSAAYTQYKRELALK